MKQERALLIEGRKYTLLISDEPQALLEAKASGRAVLGCMSSGKTDEKATDSWDLNGIPYVIPSIEYATDELTELILRRYLGLPWLIDETERLVIREFIKEDAKNISEEEYGKEEEIFRDPDKLEAYIKNQYGFYEYGTWAVLKKAEKNAVKKVWLVLAIHRSRKLLCRLFRHFRTVCAGWNWDTIFLKPTGKMVMQKKRQLPFFSMPMKFFPPDFVPGSRKKTRLPAHWQKALEWKQ